MQQILNELKKNTVPFKELQRVSLTLRDHTNTNLTKWTVFTGGYGVEISDSHQDQTITGLAFFHSRRHNLLSNKSTGYTDWQKVGKSQGFSQLDQRSIELSYSQRGASAKNCHQRHHLYQLLVVVGCWLFKFLPNTKPLSFTFSNLSRGVDQSEGNILQAILLLTRRAISSDICEDK